MLLVTSAAFRAKWGLKGIKVCETIWTLKSQITVGIWLIPDYVWIDFSRTTRAASKGV